MITEVDGDLLSSDVDALVNTVNTVGIMGKGIALQFKRTFPENFRIYAKACKAGQVRVGHMFVVPNDALSGPRWIINFPTKQHWKNNSKIEWVREGLDDLIRTVRDLGVTSIAIPPLGAGNGGLDWPTVEELIRSKLAVLDDVDIRVYRLAAGHHAIAGKPVRMTWGRAALIRMPAAKPPLGTLIAPDETVIDETSESRRGTPSEARFASGRSCGRGLLKPPTKRPRTTSEPPASRRLTTCCRS